jgi:hypothetical protein
MPPQVCCKMFLVQAHSLGKISLLPVLQFWNPWIRAAPNDEVTIETVTGNMC